MKRTGPATVTILRIDPGLRFQLPVYCGKIALAKLPHSTFFQIQLPLGEYSFRSSDKQVVEVPLEEGQELYLQLQLVIVGGFKGHLVRVDNADGEEKVANLNELQDKEVRKVSNAGFAKLKAAPETKIDEQLIPPHSTWTLSPPTVHLRIKTHFGGKPALSGHIRRTLRSTGWKIFLDSLSNSGTAVRRM